MKDLEARGLLDRAVETLPDDAALAERQAANEPLTRAEIGDSPRLCQDRRSATISRRATCSTIRRSPASSSAISRRRCATAYRDEIEAHRLRREIIATRLANAMINRGGPTYLVRVADRCEATPRGDRPRLSGGARGLRARQAQRGDRRARRQSLRHRAARPLSCRRGPAPRKDGLVRTECEFCRRHRRGRRRPTGRPSPRSRAFSMRSCRHRSARRWRRARRPSRRPAYRRPWPGGSRSWRRLPTRPTSTSSPSDRARRSSVRLRSSSPSPTGSASAASWQPRGALPLADRFDRLAIDRALDTLADARRRIATEALLADREAADPLGAWIGKRARAVERALATVITGEAEEPSVARRDRRRKPACRSGARQPLRPATRAGTARPRSARSPGGCSSIRRRSPSSRWSPPSSSRPISRRESPTTPVEGQALWGYATAAAGLTIALLSPVLGADRRRCRTPQAVDRGLLGDARRRLGGALVRRTGRSRSRSASSPSPSAPSAPNSPPSSTTP